MSSYHGDMAGRIVELKNQLRNSDEVAAKWHRRIKELESEKSSHVTGATIHPSLCDEYTKACAEIVRLRSLLKRISDLCIEGNTAIEHVISDIAREGEK